MPEITAATRPAIERVSFSDQESETVVYGVPAGRWEVPNGPVAVAVVTPRGNIVTLFDWQDGSAAPPCSQSSGILAFGA